MRYRIEIEQRYKLHKLARETRHYEELFGIVHVLGEIDEHKLKDILIYLARNEISQAIEQWNRDRQLRIYLSVEELHKILSYFNYSIKVDERYDYVLVIRPLII